MSSEVGKFVPLGDRLTVVLDADDMEVTASGVIAALPGTREKPMYGSVTSVGRGCNMVNGEEKALLDPSYLSEGSRVCFGRYSGTEVELNGEKLLVIRETDILGVVLPPAESLEAAIYETGIYERAE